MMKRKIMLCFLSMLGACISCYAQDTARTGPKARRADSAKVAEISRPEEEYPKASDSFSPPEIKSVTIKFESDADAGIMVDGIYKGVLKKDVPNSISFEIGQTYSLKATSILNEKDFIKWDYKPTIADNGGIEHIHLQDTITERAKRWLADYDSLKAHKNAEFRAEREKEKSAALKIILENLEMITVDEYKIAKYECTNALWNAVWNYMGYNNSSYRRVPNNSNPVENVNMDQIKDFLDDLNEITGKNYRLPSMNEWANAAKGGKLTHNYNYSGSNNAEEVGWTKDNSMQETHPVGQKKPNELGIYDMTGNVSEWTGTLYQNTFDFEVCGCNYAYFNGCSNEYSRWHLASNANDLGVGFRLATSH